MTLSKSPLDEWSARRIDPYVTTNNTQKKTDVNAPTGFEPAIPASELQQTSTLERTDTAISFFTFLSHSVIGIALRYNAVPN